MKRDYLANAALGMAIVVTASAEYELARRCGYGSWVSAALPGALDVYAVRALRASRDVVAVVVAMILVNAGSHLVTAGLLPVNVPLVVAVSAIAPLVMWRVHALRHQAEDVPETDPAEDIREIPLPPVLEVEREPYPPVPVDLERVPVPVLAAAEPRTRVSAPVPDVPEDELIARTRTDFPGIPTYRELREKYGIGQARAKRIRAVLEEDVLS